MSCAAEAEAERLEVADLLLVIGGQLGSTVRAGRTAWRTTMSCTATASGPASADSSVTSGTLICLHSTAAGRCGPPCKRRTGGCDAAGGAGVGGGAAGVRPPPSAGPHAAAAAAAAGRARGAQPHCCHGSHPRPGERGQAARPVRCLGTGKAPCMELITPQAC